MAFDVRKSFTNLMSLQMLQSTQIYSTFYHTNPVINKQVSLKDNFKIYIVSPKVPSTHQTKLIKQKNIYRRICMEMTRSKYPRLSSSTCRHCSACWEMAFLVRICPLHNTVTVPRESATMRSFAWNFVTL